MRGPTSFDVLSVNVRAGVLAVDDWMNPQKQKRIVNMRTSEGVYFAYMRRRNP